MGLWLVWIGWVGFMFFSEVGNGEETGEVGGRGESTLWEGKIELVMG